MQKLVRGIQDFQRHLFSGQRAMFERLADGQKPEALLITCSDSRIDPNLFTQTVPGDLFVLRNAGNFVPPHGASVSAEEATIEYGIVALGIRDIIICGHSYCGAIKALLAPDSVRAAMPAVGSWLSVAEAAARVVREKYANLPRAEQLNVAIQENVLAQLENLQTLPAVADALQRGELNLYGWVYKFETGQVFGYQPQWNQFMELTQTTDPLPGGPVRRSPFRLNVI